VHRKEDQDLERGGALDDDRRLGGVGVMER